MIVQFTEKNTTQQGVIDLLITAGWQYVPGKDLPRTTQNVVIESDVNSALERLNPHLTGQPDRVDAALIKLRQAVLATETDGLMAANETFTELLRGRGTTLMPDTGHDEPFRVIDFERPERNSLIVSDEVTYRGARFDIVLWVNGIPVVVGEAKSPTQPGVTWRNAALDIHVSYETAQPGFFVPNLLSFATDGKEFRYAGVRTPLDHWNKWGDSDTNALLDGWPRVKLSVEQLLAPATVLNLLEHYALFDSSDADGSSTTIKLLPRYFQYETVERVIERVLQGPGQKGLIYHTQGSGKTLAMGWVATRLVLDPRMKNPTVIAVADRTQLVTQTWNQFASAGAPDPVRAVSARGLHQAIAADRRGIIVTTVHKFENAGHLSDRENIIVLVDEAHRTQEGSLGQQMREALPNASWFGFTGTPIADGSRNTFELFGDPSDPARSLSTYNSDRSIADGTTVPMMVVPRPVKFRLRKEALDEAFDQLAEEERLTDAQKETFAGRLSTTRTFLLNPERIRVVVEDIVSHYTGHVEPNGMKAQVVVGDQELCILYQREFERVFAERGLDWESAVVISATGGKSEFEDYRLSDAEEEQLLDRFRTYGDPLRFLVVTAKLGTGFNAPIEGVLYLDKPLKLHTLFQTITRTNRPWKNPETGLAKQFGLIVDYIGLGDGFARAIAPADPERAKQETDIEGLLPRLRAALDSMLGRFVGVEREDSLEALQDALARIPADSAFRSDFLGEFQFAQGLWETIAPHPDLRDFTADYRWLAQVYNAIPRPDDETETLWARLGAKTRQLVHEHMTRMRVEDRNVVVQIADADTIQRMVDEGRLPKPPAELKGKSASEIIDSLTERIKRRLEGPSGGDARYRSIADRLDRLRERVIERSEDSIDWLTEAFEVAAELKEAEEADDAGLLEDLPDPRIGTLTRIFNEHRPVGKTVLIEEVVQEVDRLVRHTTFEGWASREDSQQEVRKQLRRVFRRYKLPLTGEPFKSAWKYILASY